MMYIGSWKIFFSPIRASYWLLDSFEPPEPKTFDSYFLDMMYFGFMKYFLLADSSELMAVRLISAPEPKNVWFLLSRHDVPLVHEKFSCRLLEKANGCQTHIGLSSPKTFDSEFLHMLCVGFMKNYLLADSNELLAVRLILASWA